MGVNVVVSGGNINVGTGQAGSAAVSNSDDSYQATVAAGGSLELPDITITKNDDSTVTYPSVKDIDIGVIDPCVPSAPSGWDAMVAEYGIGYDYVQPTGQSTSYRTGDDANIEATVFTAAVRAANGLKPQQSLSSFLVLNNNNAEGNTTRFLDELGGTSFTNNLVIDHLTGLMWYRILSSSVDWNTNIDNALASTQGGYEDWFMPNLNQMQSINNHETGTLNYTPFNLSAAEFGTSTSWSYTTTSYYYMRRAQFQTNGLYDVSGKTVSNRILLCRKHY